MELKLGIPTRAHCAGKGLNEHNSQKQNNAFQNFMKNESGSQNGNLEISIKLPNLSIKEFFGDSSSWLEFWGINSNAIEKNSNLTPVDKFVYLKSLLGGSAYNAIAGFSLSEENFKAANDLLKTRYGRDDLVINAHMSKLLNLKQVKNASNVRELRELYNSCEIQIRNLNALGVTARSYGHLCPILLKLIPSEIALYFNRKITDSEKMEVEELLSVVENWRRGGAYCNH